MSRQSTPLRRGGELSSEPIGLEILKVRVPDGIEEKPYPVIFLHGAFSGAWCWADHFLGYFAIRGYTCYAPSFRGHAGSEGVRDINDFGIDDYVHDVLSVMEELKDPPILVGHSMGGFIAMKVAERRDLAGLALLSSVPPGGLAGPSLSLAMWNPFLLSEIGMVQVGRPEAMSERGLRDALFSPRMSSKQAGEYLRLMGPESLRAMREMHGLIQVDPRRIRGRCPTFVMGGAEDGLIAPAFVKSTARQLGHRAAVLPRIGHAIMLDEDWESAAQTLENWTSRIV